MEVGISKYTVSALCTLLMYLIPLLIFTKGLFLRRDVLPNTSRCTKDMFSACYHSGAINCSKYYNSSSSGQYCTSSHYKVILIFIDALRYDFTEYQENLDVVPPYLNKIHVIRDLLKTRDNHARLFKFIADPPSTTMQRIKGLTTGSLPTFIEIGSNFFSGEIDENNIVDVLKVENKNVIFLGDDTWMKLYPRRFHREFPFDSFNVWDLDSVDNGVREYLIPEIRKSDWHLLIAHFLGVDHCGHRYGPDHPEMERKLSEMNDVIKKVVREIRSQENVLLFVIGDHGMTPSGNHGGETDNELNSALFVYSPVQPLYFDASRTSQSIRQVDLVPTLTTILGVSIPFSNTGRIILDCLPKALLHSTTNITFVLWQSIEQLTRYISEYSSHSDQFRKAPEMNNIFKHYEKLKKMWLDNTHNRSEFIMNYDIYMKNVVEMFRKAWIQFNSVYISIGNVLMATVLILNISNLLLLSNKELLGLWFQSYKFSLLVLYLIAGFLLLFSFIPSEVVIIFVVIIEIIYIHKIFQLSVPVFRRNFHSRLLQLWKNFSILNNMALIIVISSFIWLFTNSYILEEARACFFLLISYVWTVFLFSQQKSISRNLRLSYGWTSNIKMLIGQPKTLNFIIITICLKISSYFVKCREEQDYCRFQTEDKIVWKYFGLILLLLSCFVKFKFPKTLNKKCKVFATVRIVCLSMLFLSWASEIFLGSSEKHTFVDKIPAVIFVVALSILCFILCNSACNEQNSVVGEDYFKFNFSFIHFHVYLLIVFNVIVGLPTTVPITLMFLYLPCLASYLQSNISDIYNFSWNQTIVWGLSSNFWFYAMGQNALFSSIQWDAAFLFEKDIGKNMTIPSILVTISTFSSFIIHGFLLLYLLIPKHAGSSSKQDRLYFNSFMLGLQYVTYLAIRIFGMMLCCTIHSRHLMMWMIFAPKFIFEGLSFIISSVSVTVFGFIFVFRLNA